jgi:ankyrin repeat protein
VKHSLPTRKLAERPDLGQLKRQAKELLEAFLAGEETAVSEVNRFYHDGDTATFALHDAQLVLARSYGYSRWPKLKAYVDGVTVKALVDAVRASDEEQVRAVLKIRPELVNTVEAWNNEHTALHYAVLCRMPAMVRVLMEFGANPHAGISPHTDATSALTIATERGYDEIVAIIRQFEKPSESERPAMAVPAELRRALQNGDEEFLRKRHAKGELITPRDEEGWLLRLAIDYDRPEMLKLLLDFGLDPDARVGVDGVDEIAFTWGMPLYQCARYGKHATAEMLLERGADPNAQVYASGTPLSEAYGQRDERMIALLERYGGKSNAAMAGFYRRKDLAQRLLAEHGDAVLPDDGFGSGKVAEQLLASAARGGDPEILQMAIERIDWPNGDPRWYGALKGPLEFWNHWIGPWCHHEWDRSTYLTCFKTILERCGPPNRQHRFGVTLLHEIVTMGDHVAPEERVAFATAALDMGSRLDLRDDLLRSTPLGWACRWGREELVRLFLDRGADPVEPDAEPWASPLAWAEKKGHHAALAILRITDTRE